MTQTFRIVDGVPWVGPVAYQWAKRVMHDVGRTGFHLEFDNGYVLSVQFGKYAYCQNYMDLMDDISTIVDECINAEIAIMNPNGSFAVTFPDSGDNVQGYVLPEQVNALVKEMITWTTDEQNEISTNFKELTA